MYLLPRRIILFFIVSLTNFWIWEIFNKSVFVAFALMLISFLLFLSFNSHQKNPKIFFASLFLLALLQIFLTEKHSLFRSTPLEMDTQTKRMNAYVTSIPRLGYQLEMRKEIIAVYKMQSNLVDFFDINYYFFGSYPRELQKPGEFEKFSFILLPFFLRGFFRLLKNKSRKILIYVTFFAVLVALIGDKSHYGILAIYPLMVISITKGFIK